jgi:hypothetical protein
MSMDRRPRGCVGRLSRAILRGLRTCCLGQGHEQVRDDVEEGGIHGPAAAADAGSNNSTAGSTVNDNRSLSGGDGDFADNGSNTETYLNEISSGSGDVYRWSIQSEDGDHEDSPYYGSSGGSFFNGTPSVGSGQSGSSLPSQEANEVLESSRSRVLLVQRATKDGSRTSRLHEHNRYDKNGELEEGDQSLVQVMEEEVEGDDEGKIVKVADHEGEVEEVFVHDDDGGHDDDKDDEKMEEDVKEMGLVNKEWWLSKESSFS